MICIGDVERSPFTLCGRLTGRVDHVVPELLERATCPDCRAAERSGESLLETNWRPGEAPVRYDVPTVLHAHAWAVRDCARVDWSDDRHPVQMARLGLAALLVEPAPPLPGGLPAWRWRVDGPALVPGVVRRAAWKATGISPSPGEARGTAVALVRRMAVDSLL